jgi:hypothetical protein
MQYLLMKDGCLTGMDIKKSEYKGGFLQRTWQLD